MSWIAYPDYYPKFVCSADKCKDTCCQHWEIDIDDKTLEYFKSVDGELGEKLMANIVYEDDCQYIKLDSHDMCPFLENGLCSLYSKIGEEHISNICREHPRWYNWYSEGKECGLGLCCEEVAKLILDTDYKFTFTETESDEINEDYYSPDDMDAEDFLLAKRELLFEFIKKSDKSDTDYLFNMLFDYTGGIQYEYNDIFLAEHVNSELKNDVDFAKEFFVKKRLDKFISYLLTFDIIDERWREYLENLLDNLEIVLLKRRNFLLSVYTAHGDYQRLLHYFIYRYFTQSFDDDDILSKVNFALVSTGLIQLLDVLEWLENGRLTTDAQVDICKIFSGEIEYDTDNMKKVREYRFI